MIFLAYTYSSHGRIISLGNEIDCTRPRISHNGDLYYHYTLFDESNWYETILHAAANSIIQDALVYSPMAPIFEISILKLLRDLDPSSLENLIACWRVGTKHKWCGNCGKCIRYHHMYKLLDIDMPESLKGLEGRGTRPDAMTPKDLFSPLAEYWYPSKLVYIPDKDVRNALETFYSKHMPQSNKRIYRIHKEEKYD